MDNSVENRNQGKRFGRGILLRVSQALLVAGGLLLALPVVNAQPFPRAPIRLIIPFTPGGATDLIGRQLGAELSKRVGQPIVIENRAGATGAVGMKAMTLARPDGYTLALGAAGNVSVDPALEKLPYDPATDMIAVAPVVSISFVVFAHPSFPPNNIRELIDFAKRNPGKINFASSGTGGSPHLASELLKSRGGFDMLHIPYKGAVPAITDVVSGEVQMMTGDANTASPFIQRGRLKALAVTGAERMDLLPNVPTVAESGLPGFEANNWFGIFAPAKTPSDIVEALHEAVEASVQTPAFAKGMAALGGRRLVMSRADFIRYIASQTVKRSNLIKSNKLDLSK
ncbi:MAG: tripartite tricarboxylate transporter substrate binding protein [Pseudomonadota bacterium]